MQSDQTTDPRREPATLIAPPRAWSRRALLTGALALAALLGNWFGLPVSFGVDFLFGSIAVMLALAWLGTGAGLTVALVSGAYTWLLWDHPYALLIFLAEAAAVGWHRDRARRRGQHPPPLAVSAAIYWLLLGIPLALLAHRFVLGMGWTPTLLITLKQALNGILNAALADLVLVAGALLTRRKSALPLAQVLFGVLLAGMLVPSLVVNAWENRGLKDRLEIAQAERLRLFGALGVQRLGAEAPTRGPDPAALQTQLLLMRQTLTENLPASADPQLRLEQGPRKVPETGAPAAPPSWPWHRQHPPGQVLATAAPGLSLILPGGRYASRVARWHQAVYRMEIPVDASPLDTGPGGPGASGDAAPPGLRLVMEVRAAPLIEQIHGAAARLLVLLLAVALLGLLVAARLSRRLVRPLHDLAQGSRALPAAIRAERPWPAPVAGLLAETGELADAVAEMADSLSRSFRTLREERDQREALNRALSEERERFRTLFETMAGGVIYRDERGTITDADPAALRLLAEQTAQRLRTLIETSPHGIVEADPLTRRLLWGSASMLRLFGYTPTQWQGLRVEDLHPVESGPLALAEFARMAQADLAPAVEVPCRRRDGSTFYCKVSPGLLRLGQAATLVAFFTDVSAERQARLALEHAQESLLKAQAIAHLGSWEYDHLADRVSWSPEAFRIFEQDPERFEATYEGMLSIVHPEDRALLDLVYRESLATGTAYELVHRLLMADGRIKWVHERGETEYAADGRPLRSRGTTQDITERKVADLALADQRRRLANIIAATRVATWEWELQSGTGTVNERWAEIIGHHRADFATIDLQTWMDLTHPDDLQRALDLAHRHVAGEVDGYECELRMRHKDGHWVWVQAQGRVVEWDTAGRPLVMSGIQQDITELRAATERREALEAALTQYSFQLEELVDVISLPLAPAEQVSTLLWLACHSLGMVATVLVQLDEERGHRVLFAARDDTLNGVTPRLDRALLAESLTRLGSPWVLAPERLPGAAIAAGLRSCVAMAFACPRPDGQTDTLVLSLWGQDPSLDLSGPARQIVRLIAQRLAAVRYQEQVQHDLMAAKGRETIGHLASGIAHDFNNLLGVIDANIFFLASRLGELGRTDPELHQVLAETQSALGQAKVITSGMLSLSRAGGVPLELVDLGPSVAELGLILRQLLPPAIDLRVRVGPETRAWTNGAFLQSALLNLALNARDAMPAGGALSIAAEPLRWEAHRPLAVGALPAGDCIALRVSDTGSGIAPSLLTRIFDPLFSTKAARRGHGLGLFMVQEFVTRSGAGLLVDSQPERGTDFTLLLPRAAPQTPAGGPTAPPDAARPPTVPPALGADGARAAPLAGLRVLVVEDDPRVREAVGRLLTLDGARQAAAKHGQAGLDLLERDSAFDLVLSDIAMPVLDGIELLQRLAQAHARLPVILMTGQKDALSALDALCERPTVLRKPLDPAALRSAILAATGARAGLAPGHPAPPL